MWEENSKSSNRNRQTDRQPLFYGWAHQSGKVKTTFTYELELEHIWCNRKNISSNPVSISRQVVNQTMGASTYKQKKQLHDPQQRMKNFKDRGMSEEITQGRRDAIPLFNYQIMYHTSYSTFAKAKNIHKHAHVTNNSYSNFWWIDGRKWTVYHWKMKGMPWYP